MIGGRSHVSRIETITRNEKESKAKKLAEDVARASFAHIEMQVNNDMEHIRKAMGDTTSQAVETALDLKYMRDRQKKLSCIQNSVPICFFGIH